jgi:hypothetical protein
MDEDAAYWDKIHGKFGQQAFSIAYKLIDAQVSF